MRENTLPGPIPGRVASWHTINKKFVKIKQLENEN